MITVLAVFEILMMVYSVLLYMAFRPILQNAQLAFLKKHVHIFFLFIIAYQGLALCIMLTQAAIYDKYNGTTTPRIVM